VLSIHAFTWIEQGEIKMSMDDAMNDARKTAKDVKNAAGAQLAATQDDLITFAQQKPLVALLSAFAVGIVVGKTIL
jgi:ElaB/YqjD/DUF883 family membrane-anchored ribosome-binding protein